jgi:hypothetical protein
VVFFLQVGCAHYQFNFHTINEMNLSTHQKVIDFIFFGFELLINGSLFFGSAAKMSFTTKAQC